MKYQPFILLVILFFTLVGCNTDTVIEFKVTDTKLHLATTESYDGLPILALDSVNHQLFALNSTFTIASNYNDVSYDSYEDYAIDQNPITNVKIWCDEAFCSTPAGNNLNHYFYVFTDSYLNAYRLMDSSGLNLLNDYGSTPFYNSIYFICDTTPQIGYYTFHIAYTFSDGSLMYDDLNHIKLR